MRLADAASLNQTVSVAIAFWALCLALALLEASIGENALSSGVFLLSVPALVAALTWANRAVLGSRARLTALLTLGVSVLVYASVILFVGLLAASALKRLLS